MGLIGAMHDAAISQYLREPLVEAEKLTDAELLDLFEKKSRGAESVMLSGDQACISAFRIKGSEELELIRKEILKRMGGTSQGRLRRRALEKLTESEKRALNLTEETPVEQIETLKEKKRQVTQEDREIIKRELKGHRVSTPEHNQVRDQLAQRLGLTTHQVSSVMHNHKFSDRNAALRRSE